MAMNLRYATLAGAVVAALGGSQAALALPASTINSPSAAVVHMGGATSTDGTMLSAFLLGTGGICAEGGDVTTTRIDVYHSANDKIRAVACLSAITLPAGFDRIVFQKESNGGSGNGTKPVSLAQPEQFLDLANGGFACTDDGYKTPVGSLTYHNWIDCTPLKGATTTAPSAGGTPPIAGIADVEPALFGLTVPEQAGFKATVPVSQVVFAPGVSLNLYRKLQAMQGLTADDLPEHVPSLSEVQLRSIFTGKVLAWNAFKDSTGQLMTAAASLGGAPSSGRIGIYFCRRTDTSGTHATFATHFARQGLGDSVVKGNVTPGWYRGFTASGGWSNDTGNINTASFGNSESADVRRCLDAHHDNGDWAIGGAQHREEVRPRRRDKQQPGGLRRRSGSASERVAVDRHRWQEADIAGYRRRQVGHGERERGQHPHFDHGCTAGGCGRCRRNHG